VFSGRGFCALFHFNIKEIMTLITNKNVHALGMTRVGSTWFDGNAGQPQDCKHYVDNVHVDAKGYFHPQHLKTID
jgi:hypothetical protein